MSHALEVVWTSAVVCACTRDAVPKVATLTSTTLRVFLAVGVDQAGPIDAACSRSTVCCGVACTHDRALVANARLTCTTICGGGTRCVLDALSAEEITQLCGGTVCIESTLRSEATPPRGALAPCWALSVCGALTVVWSAHAVGAALTLCTICAGLTHRHVGHARADGCITDCPSRTL